MKLLLALALAVQAAPLPIGLPDAAKAAPPRREKRVKQDKKELELPPATFGGSGYDYFHLMAAPGMAGQAVTTTAKPAKKKTSAPELRDAVASPKK